MYYILELNDKPAFQVTKGKLLEMLRYNIVNKARITKIK